MERVTTRQGTSGRWWTAGCALTALAALLACKRGGDGEKAAPSARTPPTASAPRATASAAVSAAPSFADLVAQSRPVTARPVDFPLGKVTVKAELCAVEGGGPLGKSRSSVLPSLALQGTRLFAVDADRQLRVYDVATAGGCKLTPVRSAGAGGVLALDPKVASVSAGGALVVASSGVFGSTVLKDLKPYYQCEARPQGTVAVDPSGTFGIGHFANATVARVTFTETRCASVPWVFQDLGQPSRKGVLSNVNSVGFMGSTVLVGGILAKEVNPKEPRVVLGLSGTGQELFRLGNVESSVADDGLGWVHAVSGCGVGICVLDGNFRKLALYSATRDFIGKVDLDRLFGIEGSRSGWYGSFAVAPDRSLYVAAGVDREGGKVAEGLVFRVTGL